MRLAYRERDWSCAQRSKKIAKYVSNGAEKFDECDGYLL